MIHNTVIVAKTAEEAAVIAADHYEELLAAKPDAVLGLATGSTPVLLYQELISREQQGKINFSKVKSANLDEYKGLAPTHDQSYRYFMNDNLFDHISIDKANTIVPDGLAEDVEQHCRDYEAAIEALGGVDLQLLGLGHNGPIGFNEPDDHFPEMTHEVQLTEMTRDANKRFFASIDEVPTAAITMGIGTVMAAKKVILLVTGEGKADILKKVLYGPITPEVPATALRMHQNTVVICDEAAYSKCR